MASFTGVGDNVELSIPARGETIDIDISGTYNMTILFQREQGSPGSGAWETLDSFSTANATVAEAYTSRSDNEVVRLIVDVDTSGTATATLTDNDDRDVRTWKDQEGNNVFSLKQSGVEFYGSQRHNGTSGTVSSSAATLTLDAETHAGKVVATALAATLTITLPAATGTGDVYTIFTTITATGDHIYQAASSSDSFGGGVAIATDIAGVVMPTAATDDTVTLNGTTTGGVVGSWARFTDVASGKFMVDGFLVSTGAEATPFSAAV